MGTGSAILGGAAMAALISGIFGLINRRLDITKYSGLFK